MIKVSTFFIILQFSGLAVADYESDIKFFAINSEKYGTKLVPINLLIKTFIFPKPLERF